MNNKGEIRFLKNHEIDYGKWDACIDASPGGLVYALSWYLDIVNPGWCALVEGDYKTVMPLPVRKKYGITYLIQPFLTQQLGVFSAAGPDGQLTGSFLDVIFKKYKYINISLNRSNPNASPNFDYVPKANHELDLSAPYFDLERNYSRRAKRNILKAKNATAEIADNIDASVFTTFKATYSNPRLDNRFKTILEGIVNHSIKKSVGKVLAAKGQNGEITAAAFYLWYKNRVYILVTASSEYGKTASAMHLLVDQIIRGNAGSAKILDFTGSNLKGVAYFNEGFGAKAGQYFYIYSNRIPLLRILKK